LNSFADDVLSRIHVGFSGAPENRSPKFEIDFKRAEEWRRHGERIHGISSTLPYSSDLRIPNSTQQDPIEINGVKGWLADLHDYCWKPKGDRQGNTFASVGLPTISLVNDPSGSKAGTPTSSSTATPWLRARINLVADELYIRPNMLRFARVEDETVEFCFVLARCRTLDKAKDDIFRLRP
jgi:hypothetical protein